MPKNKLPFSDSACWKSPFYIREGKAPLFCSFPASNTMAMLPSWLAQPFGVQPQAHQAYQCTAPKPCRYPPTLLLLLCCDTTSLCAQTPTQVNWHYTHYFGCTYYYLLFFISIWVCFYWYCELRKEKSQCNPVKFSSNSFKYLSVNYVCLWKLLSFDVILDSNQI